LIVAYVAMADAHRDVPRHVSRVAIRDVTGLRRDDGYGHEPSGNLPTFILLTRTML
jgi:phosphatidate phosphatase APP1